MTRDTDLLPCPFCGAEPPDLHLSHITGRIFCEGCGAEGPWSPAFDGDWNTRAHPVQEPPSSAPNTADLLNLIRWAHDTLYEINPSNYDHDEVCRLNDASVEVILGLAPVLGETHGKSPEWWTDHRVGPLPSPGVTAGATGPVSDADFLRDAGMDGAKWAAGFKAIAERLGHHGMDEGWLIGWFCNAIMAGYDEAERRYRNPTPAPVVPAERVTNRRAYQVGYAAGKAAALRSAPPVGARVKPLVDDIDRLLCSHGFQESGELRTTVSAILAALMPAGKGEE